MCNHNSEGYPSNTLAPERGANRALGYLTLYIEASPMPIGETTSFLSNVSQWFFGTWRDEGVAFEAPNLSALAEKSWTPPIDRHSFGAGRSLRAESGMTDVGLVHLVFYEVDAKGVVSLKTVRGGAQDLLDATRGWPAARPIDLDAQGAQVTLSATNTPHFNLAVSSIGHGLVSWVTRKECPTAVQAPIAGSMCQQMVISEANPYTDEWSPAQTLDLPLVTVLSDQGHTASINDLGNWVIAIKAEEAYLPGQATATGLRSNLPLVIRKIDGQITTHLLNEREGTNLVRAVIDHQNRVATAHNVGTTAGSTRVAIREISLLGNLSTAFFPNTSPTVTEYVLDLAVGKNGGFALAMGYPAPFGKDLTSVVKLNGETNWTVKQLDSSSNGSVWRIFVGDTNAVRLTGSGACILWSRSANGVWSGTRLPSICALQPSNQKLIFDREGNFVSITFQGPNEGAWYTYDAQRARVVQQPVTPSSNTSRGLLLGANLTGTGLGLLPPTGSLAPNGQAILFSTMNAEQTKMQSRAFRSSNFR